MENLSKYFKNIDGAIGKVAEHHKRRSEILSFSVVGSYSKKEISVQNDVDCLIITKNKLSYQTIKNKVLNLSAGIKLSDDVFKACLDNINFSFAYFCKKDFYEYVRKLMDGDILSVEPRSWAIGGKIHEIFLGDISN